DRITDCGGVAVGEDVVVAEDVVPGRLAGSLHRDGEHGATGQNVIDHRADGPRGRVDVSYAVPAERRTHPPHERTERRGRGMSDDEDVGLDAFNLRGDPITRAQLLVLYLLGGKDVQGRLAGRLAVRPLDADPVADDVLARTLRTHEYGAGGGMGPLDVRDL